MKKTYTINLSGKVFHIDEDAFEKLQDYLNTLKNHYIKEEDGTEIMYDIESRIAELFMQYQKENFRESIVLEDVEKAITTMGKPADIIDDEEEAEESKGKPTHKLYRDPDHMVLGGVASGLASYWGISMILIRICFILFSLYYGIFILVYIVLWTVIPKAKNSREKLEMKGKNINIPNIERSVKEEYQEIKISPIHRFFRRIGELIGRFFGGIGKAIAFLFGLSVLLFGIVSLFTFISILFLPNLMPWAEAYEEAICMVSPFHLSILIICFFFLTVIPCLFIIFLALKILISFESNNRTILLPAGVIWLVCLFLLLIVGLSEAQNYTQRTIRTHTSTLLSPLSNKIVIDLKDRYNTGYNTNRYRSIFRVRDKKASFLVSPVKFSIYASKDVEEPQIFFNRSTNASDYLNAEDKGIQINWELKNDTLRMDNYFKIEGPWRGQELDIRILLPSHCKIEFTENVPRDLKFYYLEGQIKEY